MSVMTQSSARRIIIREMLKGGSSSPDDVGRQQLSLSYESLLRAYCRRDAVGRLSIKDSAAFAAAEASLNLEGYLDGRLNGYSLVTRAFWATTYNNGQCGYATSLQ